ncbi:MAG: hypothetical protein KAI17_25745, partial [Thiotrichaceae bacterium]|nr:hypothetical protein [Thiotrichaceae bacterium]
LSINMLLSPHTKNVGTISALSGAIQMCFAGLSGELIINYWVSSQSSLGSFYILICALLTAMLLHSKRRSFFEHKEEKTG